MAYTAASVMNSLRKRCREESREETGSKKKCKTKDYMTLIAGHWAKYCVSKF